MSEETCKTCYGMGFKQEDEGEIIKMPCDNCDGSGKVNKKQNPQTCGYCDGKGDIIHNVPCDECKGLGTVAKTEYKPKIARDVIDEFNALWNQVQQIADFRRHDAERIDTLQSYIDKHCELFNTTSNLEDRMNKLEKYTSDIIDLYVASDLNLENDIIKLEQKIQLLEMNKDNKFSEFVKCWIEKIEKLQSFSDRDDKFINELNERIEKIEEKLNMLDYTKAGLDNIKTLVEISKEQKIFNANINNILEILLERLNAKS